MRTHLTERAPPRRHAMNNPLYANYKGKGYGDGPFGPTTERKVDLSIDLN